MNYYNENEGLLRMGIPLALFILGIFAIVTLCSTGGNPASIWADLSDVNHSATYTIIDKWEETGGFLLITTSYYFLDNYNQSHLVTSTDYHLYAINESYTYSWTETEHTGTINPDFKIFGPVVNGLFYALSIMPPLFIALATYKIYEELKPKKEAN